MGAEAWASIVSVKLEPMQRGLGKGTFEKKDAVFNWVIWGHHLVQLEHKAHFK